MIDRLDTDVLVIGSGPGGAVTATILAEAGKDVLLVEEGLAYGASEPAPFTAAEMRAKYRDGGVTVALGHTSVAYAEGRCLGGGSEVNAGLYHRLPEDLFDVWSRRFDIQAFTPAALEADFQACESAVNVSYTRGPLPPASLKLKDGAEKLGWKVIEVPRWYLPEQGDDGHWQHRRQSMSVTLLPRAEAAGARILTETRIDRLMFSGRRATLAQAHRVIGGASAKRLRIGFRRVVVCGGACGTAALLRRSGVTRHVGDQLEIHPTVKYVARFPEVVNGVGMGVPVHQVKEFSPELSFGCSISSVPHLALGLAGHTDTLDKALDGWRHYAVYYAMTRGKGKGSVRNCPLGRGIVVKYDVTMEELTTLSAGLRKLGQLLFEAGAEELTPSVEGYTQIRSRDALKVFNQPLPRRRTALMTIHMLGTCPMGERRDLCAVDSFGRVHGLENVFVNDGSLLPEAPGVNPQGTIMALAHRNARKMLEGE